MDRWRYNKMPWIAHGPFPVTPKLWRKIALATLAHVLIAAFIHLPFQDSG
jgi:hypothetical protein